MPPWKAICSLRLGVAQLGYSSERLRHESSYCPLVVKTGALGLCCLCLSHGQGWLRERRLLAGGGGRRSRGRGAVWTWEYCDCCGHRGVISVEGTVICGDVGRSWHPSWVFSTIEQLPVQGRRRR